MKSHLINHIHISNINSERKYVKPMIILLISFQSPTVEMEMKMCCFFFLRVFSTQKKAVSLSLGGGVAYEWILLRKYNKICDDTGSAPCFRLDHLIKDPVPCREVKNVATSAAIQSVQMTTYKKIP